MSAMRTYVNSSMSPKGVEHSEAPEVPTVEAPVNSSMSPKGVEHTSDGVGGAEWEDSEFINVAERR